jgi:hypothetical protein
MYSIKSTKFIHIKNLILSKFHRKLCIFSLPSVDSYQDTDQILKNWPGPYRNKINTIIREITDDEKLLHEASLHYINETAWKDYLNQFRRGIIKKPIEFLGNNNTSDFLKLVKSMEEISQENIDFSLDSNENIQNCKNVMFDVIMNKAKVDLVDNMIAFKTLKSTSDLTVPHEWFPLTRLTKRKIIFHGGPTNSGKVNF